MRKKTAGRREASGHKATAPHAARARAVFVDRDGTLNEMVYDEAHGLMDSPRRPDQVRLRPGAPEFVKGLTEAGFKVIVVTNQPGVAKGTLSLADLAAVNRRVAELLAEGGAAWDDLQYCPHHPEGGERGPPEFIKECSCRKPRPGMLLRAAVGHGVDLKRSWMVGDGLNDILAGQAAGCRTMLVTRLKVEQVEKLFDLGGKLPDRIVPDLAAALREIVRGERASGRCGRKR